MLKRITAIILIIAAIASFVAWRASEVKVLASHSSRGAPSVRDAETPSLVLGGFSASRTLVRQWFRDSPRIYLTGFVVDGGTEKAIGLRTSSGPSVGGSSIDQTITIGPPQSPQEAQIIEEAYTIRFNFDTETVTLVGSEQVHPYKPDRVYYVEVSGDFADPKLKAVNADDVPHGLAMELQDNFKGVMDRRGDWQNKAR